MMLWVPGAEFVLFYELIFGAPWLAALLLTFSFPPGILGMEIEVALEMICIAGVIISLVVAVFRGKVAADYRTATGASFLEAHRASRTIFRAQLRLLPIIGPIAGRLFGPRTSSSADQSSDNSLTDS